MNSFDWDAYASNATFREVQDHSAISGQSIPTMYSPDRDWLLLSSVGLDVETGDVNECVSLLDHIVDCYHGVTRAGRRTGYSRTDYHRQLSSLENDFNELCSTLVSHCDNPEPYLDPTELFETKLAAKRADST